ncbi:biotin--[acetyl-CoA-carboxylase] ligase [Ichthyenterobacterium sp. W332]|uniref:Biotin--[acetyl-CoA-carboxylase] ligase n=1 Tax=Microcosmobacter mediterraneus TaxID=3075607 RepID=A0ABU2YNC1_9FLAO|nr:biotin--[acetyl-CoA-carboxylase] ligase [Ichthyenterobacterium sp. W332]MDT0559322.1 biotin--[acetyl-CoA-carboxylase] ligase [Ichthyenterobacterium sp. W332]
MNIIKLSAIDSTNSYLKQLCSDKSVKDFTVVSASSQTHGRGQMGAKWQSQGGKNLTFSVFKDVSFLDVEQSFYISMVVSIALLKTLRLFSIKSTQIKWPNDILSEHFKIAGILIENIITGSTLKSSVIGVGLNINETIFTDLPKATSMRLISGKTYNLDEVLYVFLDELKHQFNSLEQHHYKAIKEIYLNNLFRKDKPSTFKDKNNIVFSGFIKDVTNTGNILIKVEDNIIEEYAYKEVTLLY